jgi:hypothetical protein
VIETIMDGMGKAVTRSPQGGVIQLLGKNLHACPPPPEGVSLNDYRCKHPGLDVTIAGKKTFIIATAHDSVTVIVPTQVKPTPSAQIELTYTGRSARATLEVVDAKSWNYPGKNEPLCRHPRFPDPDEHLRAFRITRFQLVRTPVGNMFVVEGLARVPDRMQVQVKLAFQGTPLPRSTRLVNVKDEAFRCAFGPFPKTQELAPGNYSADVLFELRRQSKRLRLRWVETLTEKEQDLYGRVQRREFAQVGPERYRSYCGESLEFLVNGLRP